MAVRVAEVEVQMSMAYPRAVDVVVMPMVVVMVVMAMRAGNSGHAQRKHCGGARYANAHERQLSRLFRRASGAAELHSPRSRSQPKPEEMPAAAEHSQQDQLGRVHPRAKAALSSTLCTQPSTASITR